MPPTFILSQDQTLQFLSLSRHHPPHRVGRLNDVHIEIERDFSLVAPTDGHQSRTFNNVHQSSLDFLEFTKIRRIFMNRSIVYVVKTTAPAVCITYISKTILCRPAPPNSNNVGYCTPNQIPVNRGDSPHEDCKVVFPVVPAIWDIGDCYNRIL